MRWLRDIGSHPWPIAIVAGFLIALIALAGLIGLAQNLYVKEITDGSLRYAVELETESSDLRAAAYDLRFHHRNILLEGVSDATVGAFEESYRRMLAQIETLDRMGVRPPEAPQPEKLSEMASEYYAGFRPAISGFDSASSSFRLASDRGLADLSEIERAADDLEAASARGAAEALENVERAEYVERVVFALVACGLILALLALAYTGMKMGRLVGELRKLHAEQRQAAKSRAEFLTDVSHELRTPLTVLRSNAEFGLRIDDEWPHRVVLEEIVKESVHMSRMVEDLLLLARSDSASLPLDLQRVPVSLFLAELAGRAEVLARERGASFTSEVSGEGWLRVDPARVEQAVLILVDNAAKYGPPGSGVTLTSTAGNGGLAIEVEDEGPGIPDEDLPYVFDRFYRGDRVRSRKKGGSGLGLSIAKTIAEAHGGSVSAESRERVGTRVTLRLPLASPRSPHGNPTLEGTTHHS